MGRNIYHLRGAAVECIRSGCVEHYRVTHARISELAHALFSPKEIFGYKLIKLRAILSQVSKVIVKTSRIYIESSENRPKLTKTARHIYV